MQPGPSCPPLEVNTYFEHIFASAPRGLCCPSRSAVVTQGSAPPLQVLGSVLLQDSPLSLAVSASLDPRVFAPRHLVQLHMFAFAPSSCSSTCSLDQFFAADGVTPRSGNVRALLQSNLTAASNGQLTISSLTSLPIGTMKDSVGYQILFCFVDQGVVAADGNSITAQVYGQPLAPCRFPVVFPARVSF